MPPKKSPSKAEVRKCRAVQGRKKVTQEGVPGKVDKNFKLVLVDGREASRTLVSATFPPSP